MKKPRHRISVIFAFAAVFLFAVAPRAKSADQPPAAVEVKTISLGIIFQGDRAPIEEHFRDFVSYVARKLSSASAVKGRVVVAPTVLQLVKLLQEKQVDFYMDSPYPTYLINKQGVAELLLLRWKGGAAEYRSILFTKKGNGITRLEDLRGKMIAFEDIGSTSGYFLPKIFLMTKGFLLTEKPALDAKVAANEVGYIFTNSTAKIVDLVLSNKVAAGAFNNDNYDRLDEKDRARIAALAETDSFPRHLVSVRKDLNPAVVDRLIEILLFMNEDEEGRKILQRTDNTTKFDPLPGGQETVRRKLADLFSPRGKEKAEPPR